MAERGWERDNGQTETAHNVLKLILSRPALPPAPFLDGLFSPWAGIEKKDRVTIATTDSAFSHERLNMRIRGLAWIAGVALVLAALVSAASAQTTTPFHSWKRHSDLPPDRIHYGGAGSRLFFFFLCECGFWHLHLIDRPPPAFSPRTLSRPRRGGRQVLGHGQAVERVVELPLRVRPVHLGLEPDQPGLCPI